jgi:DNA-binding MarR family transcriptional regulator
MPKSDVAKLISALANTQRLVGARFRRDEDIGIFSMVQLEILRFVVEKKRPVMKDIADYLKITPPSATFLIENLVKAGKLRRVADKKDRRVIRLVITGKGRRTLSEGFKKIKERVKDVFGKLNKEEINNLIKIHRKIAIILQNK